MRGKRLVVAGSSHSWRSPPEPTASVAFIAPFDSLLWDTALLASLFGFEFVWEGFFPAEKRRWGYYVLADPLRRSLVGRIEPRIDRERASVDVLGLWWEEGFTPVAPRDSPTPCATLCVPTCVSPVPSVSSGRFASAQNRNSLRSGAPARVLRVS